MAGCLCVRKKTDDVYTLDYRHSNLDYIPSDVFRHERTLEELYIDANQIKELPRELFCCHGLKKLSLADNEVRSIPPAIASLIHLEELDISKNGVVNIPDNIKFCKYMKRIEASVNPLGKLPEGFTQLNQLTELYLNDAFLDFLPGNFGRLSKLKILEIRENHLKTLPRSMTHMMLLQRLDIGNNDFTELPDVIGSLTCLLELWCDSNQLASLPSCIGNLSQLMFLDASKNRIEMIAAEVEGCVALGDLHLSTNMLQQLPETIGRLSNLTTLKVDDNRLSALPFSIGGLVSLSELNMGGNDLEEIPPSIGLLRHLRTLYADENFIMDLPPELGSCNGLTVLSLRSNNLTCIPDEIGRIPRLRVLNLSDNKIQFLPFSLTRLKELQALWLAENQTKPLIRLQSDIDVETGQRMLTCYLLPQQPAEDKDDVNSETGSFHPSVWEEERAQRQQIHFESVDVEDEEGKLRRQPTPYPKEMKHRIQHMRNLALKQLNVPNAETKVQGSSTVPAPGDKVVGRRDSPQKCNSGTSTTSPDKTTSPLMAKRHHLLKADKELNQRDKVHLQQTRLSQGGHPDVQARLSQGGHPDVQARLSQGGHPDVQARLSQRGHPDVQATVTAGGQDDGGFLNTSQRRGSNVNPDTSLPRSVSLDRNVTATLPILGPDSKSVPNIAQGHGNQNIRQSRNNVSYDDFLRGLAARGVQITDDMVRERSSSSFPSRPSHHKSQQHHSHHHHNYHPMPRTTRARRSAGYESDTGYRSDKGYLSDAGYRSDGGYHRGYHRSNANGQDVYSGYASDSGRRSHSRQHTVLTSDTESHTGARRNPAHQGWSQNDNHNYVYSGHGHIHNSIKSQAQNYSNVPISKRTTIRNDEMYEQSSGSSSRSRVVRSQSAGEDVLNSSSRPPQTSDSLQRSNRIRSESINSERSAASRSVHEPIREVREVTGTRNEDQWKNQLYHASVKLQKTPSMEKSQKPSEFLDHVDEPRNASVQACNPPYRPTPPYTAPHTTSQPSLYDSQSASGTPRSQGSEDQEKHSRNGPGTPQNRSLLAADHSSPYNQERPSSLPLGETRSPHTKKQLYKQTNGNVSKHDLSVNTDCGTVDSNHNTPSKNHPISNPHTPGRSNGTGTPGRVQGPGPPQHPRTPGGREHTPWNSNYEKDVAMYKQMEPPSQVSSSTDSGYGHTHLFDRTTPGEHNRSSVSTSGQPSPSTQGQSSKHVFHVTLAKNPGLGFSIAGGIGSPGNPFRPSDLGIFITRVQPDGPGAGILKPADKILEVNGLDFQKLEHSRAVDALRNSGQKVSMVIERLQVSHEL